MPANTPNLALPYPVPADTVDVPRDIQALAVKLDGYTSINPPVVTSLPGSPTEGQECIYKFTDNSASSYLINSAAWHLRFTDGIWQVIGGGPLMSSVPGLPTTIGLASGNNAGNDIAACAVPPRARCIVDALLVTQVTSAITLDLIVTLRYEPGSTTLQSVTDRLTNNNDRAVTPVSAFGPQQASATSITMQWGAVTTGAGNLLFNYGVLRVQPVSFGA